jgi:hypothetical protein
MNDNKTGKIRVLYIGGPSRSGSTVLSQILGQIPGYFNAGELLNIWDRGIKRQGVCSCGQSVDKCPIWGKVTQEITRNPGFGNADVIIGLRDKLARSSKMPLNINKKISEPVSDLDSQVYLENLTHLYQSVANTSGCRIIVDSSKNIGYAYYLMKTGIIDLYMVHFIRDSRATAYSWMHQKGDLFQLSPLQSSKTWNSRNLMAELVGRQMKGKYLRLLYEDFVREPRKSVQDIMVMLNEPRDSAKEIFISDKDVKLSPSHLIYGNPDRFKSGVVRLKYDAKWKQMRWRDKFTATAVTWPFLIRYGYPIFSRD